MALQKAKDLGNVNGFKFEKKGDKLCGYYVKTTDETINGTPAKKHLFDTPKGLVTVLGQANMYRQLIDNKCQNVWVEVEFSGNTKKLTGGKTMKLYDLSFNLDDRWSGEGTIEAEVVGDYQDDIEDDTDVDADDTPADVVTTSRAQAPRRPVTTPSAASQARTQELLGRRRA